MARSHRIPLVVSTIGIALTLSACASDLRGEAGATPASPGSVATPTAEPVDVVTDLEAPWSIAFAEGTALISERDSGRVLEVRAGGDTRQIGEVAASAARGEGGLLGLVVHDGFVYAFSTNADSGRIERYELVGAPGDHSLGEPEVILDSLPAASNHNGGRLAFGPDGMLYATTGDAGDRPSAQDLDALSGKILRMTPDGGVPADNPFADSLVYSYGHRNVQGIAWAEDGTMFASEFGQDTWDELNIIEPGGNYGWPEVEGVADAERFIDPVQQWNPSASSPSGIAVADGTVFIAALRGERLITVPVAAPATSADLFVGEYGRLRDVTAAPDGTLWVLTNNTDGRGGPRAGDDRVLSVPLG